MDDNPYRAFIDELVTVARFSVTAKQLWANSVPAKADRNIESDIDRLKNSLSQSDLAIVAELLYWERLSGIHDALVMMTDKRYNVSFRSEPLPSEPFGAELHVDLMYRYMGGVWPE